MKNIKKEMINDDELSNVAGGKKEFVEENGVVTEVLPNACFMVLLDSGVTVKASLAGLLRMNYIRVVVGDRVTVQSVADGNLSPRIIHRFKN